MDDFWSNFDHTIRDSRIKVEPDEDEDCENENIDRDPLYLSSSSKKIENTEHLHKQQLQQNQQQHQQIPKLFRNRNNSEQSTSYISGGIGDQSPALTIELQSDIEESLTAVSSQLVADSVDMKCKNENTISGNMCVSEIASGSSFSNLNSNLILLNNRTNLNNDLNSSNSVSSSNINANNLNNVIKMEVDLDENVSIKQEQEDAIETDSTSVVISNNHKVTTTTSTNEADILDDEDVNLACLSSYIKTSSIFRKSHQLEISNSTPFDDFLQEVRTDWLHFRPKTPPLSTSPSIDDCLVEFSEDTKIQIEMQRLRRNTLTPPSACVASSSNTVLLSDCDPLFLTEPFSYADILANNSCIVEQSPPFSITSTPAESPKDDVNGQSQNHQQSKQNSGIDFNLSGDSLNELNLSLGDAEDNQKVLESFLQECQIDDINQPPNFWNGILEEGNVLLDCIDDSKQKTPKQKPKKRKHWQRYQSGSSSFTIKQSCEQGQQNEDNNMFFKKDEPKCQIVKIEPPENILASPPLPQGLVSTTGILSSRTTAAISSINTMHKVHVSNQLQSQQQVISVPIVQPQIIQTPTSQIAVVYSTNSTNNFNFTPQQQQQIIRPYSASTTTPQQRLMNIKLHKQQQQRIVTQGVTQILTTNNQQQNFLQNMGNNKIYFKQESGGPNSTAVFTLSNVKIENSDQQSQSTNSIDQSTPLIVTTTPKQNTQQSGQPQIINVSNSTLAAAAARGGSIIIDGTIDGNGTYVLTSGLTSNQTQAQQQLQQQKRHLNGPNTVDRNGEWFFYVHSFFFLIFYVNCLSVHFTRRTKAC